MNKNKLLLVLLWIFNWNHIYSLSIPSNNSKIDSQKTNITNQQGDVSSIKNNNPENYDDNETFNEQGGPSLILDLKQDESKEKKDKKDKKDNFSVLFGGLALIVVGFLILRFGIRNTITIDTSKNLESSFLSKINIDSTNEYQTQQNIRIFNSIQDKIKSIKNLLKSEQINGYLDDICSNDKLHISLPNKTFYDKFYCKELKELYDKITQEYYKNSNNDFFKKFFTALTTFNQEHNNIYSISQGTDHILLSKDNCNLKFFDTTNSFGNSNKIIIEYNINPIYYVNIIFLNNFIKINFEINNTIIKKHNKQIVDDQLFDNPLLKLYIQDINLCLTPKISLSHSYEKQRQYSSDIKINNEIKLMILNFFNIEIKDVAKTDQ